MESFRAHAGFTLIEMLVVAAIVTIVTAIIFSGQGNFSNTVLLANTAYDVALTARDAETYGLGTRATGGLANAGYGLDFRKGFPSSYLFFADAFPLAAGTGLCHATPANGASAPNAYPGNCVYDVGTDPVVSTYQLGNGMTLGTFCAYASSWRCSTDASSPLTQLDIIYLRPNATSFMAENGSYGASPAVTNACLTIVSPKGATSFVSFSAAGQINARATSCP